MKDETGNSAAARVAVSRPHRIPATRASSVMCYGRRDLLSSVIGRLTRAQPATDEEALATIDAVDGWLEGIVRRASTSVQATKRPETGAILDDLDLIKAIPGQISHLPRDYLYLGFIDAGTAARTALAMVKAESCPGRTLCDRYTAVIASLLEEAKTNWFADLATMLREMPWLRSQSRWPKVKLEKIDTLDPVFVFVLSCSHHQSYKRNSRVSYMPFME